LPRQIVCKLHVFVPTKHTLLNWFGPQHTTIKSCSAFLK
jgi:hypothetical protein